MNLGKTFEGLPGWAKGGIAVAVVGVTGLVGFTIYNKIKKYMDLAKERQSGKDVKKEIAKLKSEGNIKPTISDVQAGIMSTQLKAAFDGVGTDRAAVFNILSALQNEADILVLIDVYGIREINSGIYLVPNFKGTLPETIMNEMDVSEITGKSRNDINEMLAKKGITTKL